MSENPSLKKQITLCHHQLNELFLLHQEALLQGYLQEALSLLKSYKVCHDLHMKFEDELLIPKYASLEKQGKWNATLYQQEHKKIHDLYEKIENGLVYLAQQTLNPAQLRRNIIHLLDREKSFKGLSEHHQEREEDSLLVELDAQTSETWRIEVLTSFSAEWQHKVATEIKDISVRD